MCVVRQHSRSGSLVSSVECTKLLLRSKTPPSWLSKRNLGQYSVARLPLWILLNHSRILNLGYRDQGSLYPRHTGGAVPLRFLVQTAITVVTPPVVFHSFPLPVTHFSSSRCGGTTALSMRTWRSHGVTTAV